ncbi:hypothetical protein FF1_000303 [Malus domestica]
MLPKGCTISPEKLIRGEIERSSKCSATLSVLKASKLFSYIDRSPHVYQDSSYFKVGYVSFHDQWVVVRVDDTSFFLRVETYWILVGLLILTSPDVFHVKHLVARP